MKKLIYPYLKNGRYFNDKFHKPESFLAGTLPSLFQSLVGRAQRLPLNPHQWITHCQPTRTSKVPLITWVGHATFLIQMGGINILTDPVFGDISYFHRRILPPGVQPKHMPPIDYVVISHNHRDHMDEKSLLFLKRFPQLHILVPRGNKAWFDKRGFAKVTEYMWWDSVTFHSTGYYLNGDVTFTFLPAYHWSQRGLFDQNKSLWGSWMIQSESTTIYFAGDTAYAPHFSTIGKEFSTIDVALMPIGPVEPRSWLRKMHVDSVEAIQGFLDLGAQHFVPMHWGTFLLGLDEFDRPIKLLRAGWSQKEAEMTKNQQLYIFKCGQQAEFVKRQVEPSLQINISSHQQIVQQ